MKTNNNIEKEFDDEFDFPDIFYEQKTWDKGKVVKKEMTKIRKKVVTDKLKSFIRKTRHQAIQEVLGEVEKWAKEKGLDIVEVNRSSYEVVELKKLKTKLTQLTNKYGK